MNVTIYWKTKDIGAIYDIRRWFNLPSYTSINGETPCEVNEDNLEKLKVFEEKGLIQIRYKHE